mmetsp:Transcript_24077/g.60971  ORF Transcript_24077/g.60971 Transcript_24077/m.60971 type:complete len:268 (+) Transcript_24077:13-816(+)
MASTPPCWGVSTRLSETFSATEPPHSPSAWWMSTRWSSGAPCGTTLGTSGGARSSSSDRGSCPALATRTSQPIPTFHRLPATRRFKARCPSRRSIAGQGCLASRRPIRRRGGPACLTTTPSPPILCPSASSSLLSSPGRFPPPLPSTSPAWRGRASTAPRARASRTARGGRSSRVRRATAPGRRPACQTPLRGFSTSPRHRRGRTCRATSARPSSGPTTRSRRTLCATSQPLARAATPRRPSSTYRPRASAPWHACATGARAAGTRW